MGLIQPRKVHGNQFLILKQPFLHIFVISKSFVNRRFYNKENIPLTLFQKFQLQVIIIPENNTSHNNIQ